MFATALTFLLVGIGGYAVMVRELRARQIDSYATLQRADARGLESIARRHARPADALREIDEALETLGRRPGTIGAKLIDPSHIVRAARGKTGLVGHAHSDHAIDAALWRTASYAGREIAPGGRSPNFEFVSPVSLPSGRHALEVTYDHHFLDANLASVRHTLGLIGLLALFGGGGVFYLAGGRSLMRSHRRAIERATLDGLTDLPNQRAFEVELAVAVAQAARLDQPVTLALLDLDDFKFVNDRHGHQHGDELLRRVASVLGEGRAHDRAFRIGGDEFAILLPHTDAEGAARFIGRVSQRLTGAGIAVSIGISTTAGRGSAETLRNEADAALYGVKDRGGHGVASFHETGAGAALPTPSKVEGVRQMIDAHGVQTVFQPIWNIHTGALLAFEALMRPEPRYGLAGPAEAFELAAQVGRTTDLDRCCLERALADCPELPPGVMLFLNLAPRSLDLGAAGDGWVQEAILAAGISLDRVVIEVTEQFGSRTTAVAKSLQQMRDQGLKLAIDDVGTGNSGLEMLRLVGADFVKIDRSIVVAAETCPKARGVLLAMASYASETGSFVIAEGIEDQATLDFLFDLDSDDGAARRTIHGGQGFALGRPSPGLSAEQPSLLRAPLELVVA